MTSALDPDASTDEPAPDAAPTPAVAAVPGRAGGPSAPRDGSPGTEPEAAEGPDAGVQGGHEREAVDETDAGAQDGHGAGLAVGPAMSAPTGAGDGPSALRRLLRLGVRAVVALVLADVVYLAVTFVQVWDASRSDDARPSEAIIVLGAAQYDCRPSPVLRNRLDHARALYEDGIAGRIVVTGGRRAGDRCTEAQAGYDHLRQGGVPDEALLLEVQGRNTWESLAASANFLRDEGISRVVLVTDGYHALRVKAIADDLGLDAVVSPVGSSASLRELAKETLAVATGRVIGFRRLVDVDDRFIHPET